MSFNLVELVKGQLSDQVLGQISHAVGENSDATKSVIDSAIPALLGGFMDKASSDDGASALFDAVKNQDDSILDNLAGVVGGDNKDSLIDSGSNLLGSLFGGSAATGLLSAVSGTTGTSPGAAGSIMGMLAPMVTSTVKRYMSGGGEMDKAGLSNMLMSQKENIAGAMPSGLADQLGSSGFLNNVGDLFGDSAGVASAATTGLAGAADKVGDVASGAVDDVTGAVGSVADGAADLANSAADSVSNAAGKVADVADDAANGVKNAASEAADTVTDVAEGGASWIKRLLPIVILAILAFLALKFFGGKASEAPEVSSATTPAVTEPAAATEPAAVVTTPAVSKTAPEVTATTPAVSKTTPEVTETTSAISKTAAAALGKGADITGQLKGLFDSAQTSLGSITDLESAKAAIPQLTDFSGKLDGIASMADKLPEAAKPIFNSVVQGGVGQMQPMLDKVMAIPGIGAVLGGVIEPLKEKLTALAG